MKKIGVFFMVLAFAAFLTGPVWAENPRPAASQLIKSLAERNGQSLPQIPVFVNWFDLVSNAYGAGYQSVFALTNYNGISRIHIFGYVVPANASPGQEREIDLWLNPWEVVYLDMDNYLGNENGWGYLYSTSDFGAGVLIFNTTNIGGMAWIPPYYWWTD